MVHLDELYWGLCVSVKMAEGWVQSWEREIEICFEIPMGKLFHLTLLASAFSPWSQYC